MKKQYGKLSATQLHQLVAFLPEFEGRTKDFPEEARASEKVKTAVKDDGVWWAPLCKYPFNQNSAICLKSAGLDTPSGGGKVQRSASAGAGLDC